MEDYTGSLAQGSVLFSDSVDWEEHAGPVTVTRSMSRRIAQCCATAARRTSLLPQGRWSSCRQKGRAALGVHGARTEIVAAGGHDALLKFLKADAGGEGALRHPHARGSGCCDLQPLCSGR